MNKLFKKITLFIVLLCLSNQQFQLNHQQEEEQVNLSHSSQVYSADISNDGTKLVTAGYSDYDIKVWDITNSFSLIKSLVSGCGTYTVSFSNDSTKIISADSCGYFLIWEINNGYDGKMYGGLDSIYTAYFSPDDSLVITGCNMGYSIIWNARDNYNKVNMLEGHSRSVYISQMSNDSSKIATGSEDQTVKIWDATNNYNLVNTLEGHTSTVRFLRFSPDSTKLVSACYNQVLLWDLDSFSLLKIFKQAKLTANFSNDGRFIIAGGTNNTLKIWDITTKVYPLVGTLEGYHTDDIYSVRFFDDDQQIISSSADTTVNVLKIKIEKMCLTHYENVNGVCQLCSIDKDYCSTCNEGLCETCFTGFYLDENENYICVGCNKFDQNCQICAKEGCQHCYSGYYLEDKKCKSCEKKSNCLRCTKDECQKCKIGYILLGKECIECSEQYPYCNSCNDEICSGCEAGYYLDDNKACQECPLEGFQNSDKCIGFTITCEEGFYLNQQKQCVECKIQCKKCGTNSCLECISGYFLNRELVCETCSDIHKHRGVQNCDINNIKSCVYGFYLDEEENECKDCYSNFNLCQSCNNEQCFACYQGYYLNGDNQCSSCSEQYKNCKICSPDYCIACIEGKPCNLNGQVQEENIEIELTESQNYIKIEEKVSETDVGAMVTLGIVDIITILLFLVLMIYFCRKYKQQQQKNKNLEKSFKEIQNCFSNLDEYQKILVYEQFHKKQKLQKQTTDSGQPLETKENFLTKSQSSNSNDSPTTNEDQQQQTEIHATDVQLTFPAKITIDQKE